MLALQGQGKPDPIRNHKPSSKRGHLKKIGVLAMSLQARYKNNSKLPAPTTGGIVGLSKERHYTVKELAELWGFSKSYVYELFENEPGVLKPCRPEIMNAPTHDVLHKDGTVTHKRGKRKYCPLRIPESVASRVHARYDGKVA